jgi:hypothetical protein
MQEWEYCVVQQNGNTVTYFGKSGKIDIKPSGLDFYRIIATLGNAGWELVGIPAGPFIAGLYFKRPVQPGRTIDDAF